MSLDNLHEFRCDKFSQNGEDGILEKLLTTIGLEGGYFVEFGAWDGEHLSNCRALVDKGWDGCFIEASAKRFELLSAKLPMANIQKLNVRVALDGENSLDAIFKRSNIKDVHLLSIDIDSDDLAIWRSLRSLRPQVVVIEYNPTIPFDTYFTNEPGRNYGNSALSIVTHAASVHYRLVCGTDANLIFVADEADPEMRVAETTLHEVKCRVKVLRYFFGFDGTLLVDPPTLRDQGITELYPVPWCGLPGTQPVPYILRSYCDTWSVRMAIRKFVVPLFAFLWAPLQSVRLMSRFWPKVRKRIFGH